MIPSIRWNPKETKMASTEVTAKSKSPKSHKESRFKLSTKPDQNLLMNLFSLTTRMRTAKKGKAGTRARSLYSGCPRLIRSMELSHPHTMHPLWWTALTSTHRCFLSKAVIIRVSMLSTLNRLSSPRRMSLMKTLWISWQMKREPTYLPLSQPLWDLWRSKLSSLLKLTWEWVSPVVL